MSGATMVCPDCGSANLPGADCCAACHHDLTLLSFPQGIAPAEQRLLENSINHLSLRPPLVVPPDMTLQDVLQAMCTHRVGAVVIGDTQQIQGIFTERDYLYRVLLQPLDLSRTPVREVMTRSPVTVKPSQSLAFALREMTLGRYRHLPVLNAQNQCLGILSADHVLRYLLEMMEAEPA
ncbi:MAG: CBS domain-containing protein [Nitrospirae bacterium]|nr:MAG: CBS domain-containing protein [Nitrospirota bacterium]